MAALLCLRGGNIKVNFVTRILSLQTFQVHTLSQCLGKLNTGQDSERERENVVREFIGSGVVC